MINLLLALLFILIFDLYLKVNELQRLEKIRKLEKQLSRIDELLEQNNKEIDDILLGKSQVKQS